MKQELLVELIQLTVYLGIIGYFLRDLHGVVKTLDKTVQALIVTQERNKAESREKDAVIVGEIKELNTRVRGIESNQRSNSEKFRQIYNELGEMKVTLAKKV